MSSAHVYEIMVESTGQRCSPNPSTSSSPSSSAPSSGAASPASSSDAGSSISSSSSSTRRIRRLSKTKKSSAWQSLRRSSRKFISAGRTKFAKRHSSVSSSKLRLVKYKIDKKHEEKLAASRARTERLQREREELRAGTSQLAIMCESVTTGARLLRESYERQRAVYHAYLYEVIEQEMEEEEEDEEVGAGFIGTFFY